ncbi:MAG: hypothetical protein LBE21_01270, partial [Pseudomonadales bacterium]|nr:hypothetical protein [Pseudomonadales bacterium]
STSGTLNDLSSLTLSGTGAATIVDGTSILNSIVLSEDAGADSIELLTGASLVGQPNASAYDSISNFDTSVDKLLIHDGSSSSTAFVDEGAISGANLGTAIDAAFGANDAVVFHYGNNTYVYVDDGDGDYSANDILVELVGTLNLTDLSNIATLELTA